MHTGRPQRDRFKLLVVSDPTVNYSITPKSAGIKLYSIPRKQHNA